ncbi:hypothetical protein EJ08DRAFT_614249 [Tothia fuscella]|uniref:M protein repeat protein n=1 Tax=Tothia fuscella TaxID=1048955 RepID=A0A9P4TX33_9PEZI|nr:hypothetical protein EJ08DRAFT_614249 [Tothia fuscella]
MPEAEDKEKAEKLAAAKKRVEQLKKKNVKKAAPKKKEDKPEGKSEPSTEPPSEEPKDEAPEPVEDATEDTTEEPEQLDGAIRPPHGRQPSISVQSKARSESFRKGSSSQTPTSPTIRSPTIGPSSGEGAQEVFKKQAQRLQDLERENKQLHVESQNAEGRWRKLEEELQELRESSGDTIELKKKAKQAEETAEQLEKLQSEVASLQRQNTQLQSAATKRRQSTSVAPTLSSTDELNAQLASRSETISSLELEISGLQAKLSTAQSTIDTQNTRISSLETELQKAQHTAESTSTELADLKANLDQASERAVAEGSSRSSAETRIAQVEAELGTAKRSAEEASKRAETLEKKVESLTKLHRESDSRTQAKLSESQKQERDAKELRARVTALSNENSRLRNESNRRKKLETDGDSAGLEELEDEERVRLQFRVRELEEEVFELRRGVWRDKRRELQPGLDDTSGFDDIDLSGTPTSRKPAVHSTFTDVITSGINAFIGGDGRRNSNAAAGSRPGGRKQSLGLLSEDEDDFAFDEDAFRKAQEDEAKNRLERVKQVKRGLKDWEGWKVDIADLRAGMGGVFEV